MTKPTLRASENLTENELALLKAIDRSEYGDSLSDDTWLFSARDHSGIKGKAFSGTVSSLVKKGYVRTSGGGEPLTDDPGQTETDACIGFTDAGIEAYIEAVGFDNVNKQYGLEHKKALTV